MSFTVNLEGRKQVSIQIGGHRVMTDQPVKQGGGDSSPAPYDLFIASIGTCARFYVQSYCESKGIDASGIRITLSLQRDPETKKISGFVTTIYILEELPKKLHSALKRVAEQCAVTKTIIANPEFIVETTSRPS